MNTAADIHTHAVSANYRRYALAVMTAVYTLNLVDRGLMSLLLQPIKDDLQLSDTQLGFVTGIAFGLFYATLGVPIARWADVGNRVKIASLAIGLWGATVMSCLFVTSYVQLVCTRIAAAVGESGSKPPTYSLIGDYFPGPVERTRAMSIYWLGGPLATLISFVLGGWLNELYGWRLTFFLMGIPGLLLAVVVKSTLLEPRTPLATQGIPRRQPGSFQGVLRTLWYRPSCRHLAIGLILFFTMGYGLVPWSTTFMVRSHGMGTAELGVWLGVISSIGGIVGVLSGGYVANRWFADDEAGQMRVSAYAIATTVLCYFAFLTVPQKYVALAMFAPSMLVFNFFAPSCYAVLQRLVGDEMRATTMAVMMLLANLIGMGIGPQVVGLLSDLFRPAAGADSLRYAMLIMSGAALWSAYHFWLVGRTIKEDLREAAESRGRLAVAGPSMEN